MFREDHKQQKMAQEFLQNCAEKGEEFLAGDKTGVHYATHETKE